MNKFFCLLSALLLTFCSFAQTYPQGWFRNPMNIPLQLVANFGELRANHWHMGLDIRTMRRENLPVHAAAEGFISRIKIEPGGFGRAIYIDHPNGYTTLYAHLNAFMPALENWVKGEQYRLQSWAVELAVPPGLFPVTKGQFIANSGNTGGSAGPHLHFEIRDTKTGACLNPLLFGFPIPDAVPPRISRIALYKRNRSMYAQTPQYLSLVRSGAGFTVAGGTVQTGSPRISFAVTATDVFTGYTNPNGIYSGAIFLDGQLQSRFVLDNIGYDQTRFMNAHTDYRIKWNNGPWLQFLTRLPGDQSTVYNETASDGVLNIEDGQPHQVRMEIKDASGNSTNIQFNVQYNAALLAAYTPAVQQWLPNGVNVFEDAAFEASSTETSVYDTVNVNFSQTAAKAAGSVSALFNFISPSIPVHEAITVRIKPERTLTETERNCTVIVHTAKNKKATEKARWNGDWAWARFRQFGGFQAFIDTVPPTVNPPQPGAKISFTPKDNFGIRSLRAELDGQWLRFTNNGGRTWVYTMDEKFTPGVHQLKVMVTDIAGNVTTREWTVRR